MVDDPLAKIRNLRTAGQNLAQTQTAQVTQARAKEMAAPAQEQKVVVDLRNNPVAKIMTDTQRSTDQKINQLSDYLTVKNEDYETARQRFAEFEAYFTSAQSDDMELSAQGIENLIREVEGNANLRIEAIVRDLATVQQDAEQLDRMLDALELANAQGTSVAALRDAVILNDKLLAEIKAVKDSLDGLDEQQKGREETLQGARDDKDASHQGVWNTIKRVFGEDKEIVARIEAANAKLAETVAEIELRKRTMTEKQTERNEKLEGPELTVLRTLDATEKGFSERIAETGRHALSLIRGARSSVDELLVQITQRKLAAGKMNVKVTAAAVRNAVLQGALQKTEESSKKQSETIKVRLDAKSGEIKALEGDPSKKVEKSLLEADQAVIKDLYGQAYMYLENTEHHLTTFAIVTTNNTKSEAAVRRYAEFLFNVERTMKRLQNEALPEAFQQIELGLETDQALKLSGASRSVGHTIEEAEKTAKRNFRRLAKTTGTIREEELRGLDDLTAAVIDTQSQLLEATEATVVHGSKVSVATKKALEAAGVLQEMLKESISLSANAANSSGNAPASTDGNASPERPAGGDGSATSRPAPSGASKGPGA